MELTQQQSAPQSTPRHARPRCQHVSRNGRTCRYLTTSPETSFCKLHAPAPPPGGPEAFASQIASIAAKFDTPSGVNHVLCAIFQALMTDAISMRKAGILTYIAQTILHSHRAMAQWEKRQEEIAEQEKNERGPGKLTWNLPLPVRQPEERQKTHPHLPLAWNIMQEKDIAAMARLNPQGAIAVILAQADQKAAKQSESHKKPDTGNDATTAADRAAESAPEKSAVAKCGQHTSSQKPQGELHNAVRKVTAETDIEQKDARAGLNSGRDVGSGTARASESECDTHGDKPAMLPKQGSSTSPTSSASSASSASPISLTSPPPGYFNHFYPRDPTLPAHLQDPDKASYIPPSQAELDQRNRQFDRKQVRRRGPSRFAPTSYR